ncbi:MAG: S9 family peptidase, partial [Rubrivivax sp.]|nr:S9 family peptidase [Rubrivivax sp.]
MPALATLVRALLAAALSSAIALQAQAQAPAATAAAADDPYLWLEDVLGERALGWVRERNAGAEKEFATDPGFEPLRRSLQQTLESRERIPAVEQQGPHLLNFWRDASHPRGLWRRTTP